MANLIQKFAESRWKGYTQFFLSMLLYAFSGVVVVGLKDVFGGVGQLIFRGLAAFLVVVLIMILTRKPFRFHKHYNWWLYGLDLLCRPASTLLFVYAVISFMGDANQALFYLFAFRVIASMVMDLLVGIKLTKWNWLGLVLVLVGLAVFSFPWHVVLLGVLCAGGSGVIEAVQRKVWSGLKIENQDRWMIGMTEFLSWFVIASVLFFITGSSMNLDMFNEATFWVLLLGTVIAVGTMWLDITAFGSEDTVAGNVIQSSEMGFAGVINYLWSRGAMVMSAWQISGALFMIMALVAIGMNKLKKSKT